LRYRGYSIEDLAEKSNFLEVSYLVIFGELPTAEQLHQFEEDLRKYTLVNEEMKNIIDGFPKTAHPMGVLSALTSALTAFNPKSVNVENSKEMYEAVCKTMGKFLVIATWTYRKSMGFPLNYYDNTKGYVENFMHLMFELPTGPYKADPVVINALDKLLGYLAEQKFNVADGFVVMTSRASYELIRKCAQSNIALLATISAPTSMAIEMAKQLNLTLASFCRGESFVLYTE
jgi:citrate synthase